METEGKKIVDFKSDVSCSLSDILEEQVADKYFLSEKAVSKLTGEMHRQDEAYCLDANYWKGTRNMDKKQRTLIRSSSGWGYIEKGRVDERITETDCANTISASGVGSNRGETLVSILDLYNKAEHFDRSPCLTEPHHNNIRAKIGTRIRRLTPTECERLQGFPDGWTSMLSDTRRYKAMGNAVTINVIEAIGRKLKEAD